MMYFVEAVMCGLGVVLSEEVGVVGWVAVVIDAKEVSFSVLCV